jgi:exosortase
MPQQPCEPLKRTFWPERVGAAVGGVMLLAPVAALYVPSFAGLDRVWQIDPNYSHGRIVVVASLFFAARAWYRGGAPWRREIRRTELALGIVALIVGFVLHVAALFIGMLLLDVLALVAILRGMLLALGGRSTLHAYGFACLFLIFMAPLPIAWYTPLANLMQRVATTVSSSVLTAIGVPVFVDGFAFRVPGYSLTLAEACSGMRQLTAFLAMAVAVGHLTGRAAWFTVALAAVSGFVAVAANCVRVVATVLLTSLAGPQWTEGSTHEIAGLIVIALGLLMLIAAAWGLSAVEDYIRRGPLRGRADQCVTEG